MTPFLHGFADELSLVKISGFAANPIQASGPVMPKRRLPASGATRAIGVQRMESPAAAPKPTRFRPSPGFTPKPSSDPAPKTKKPGGGRRNKGAVKERKFLPYESVPEMKKRTTGEASHNRNLAAKSNLPQKPRQKLPHETTTIQATRGGPKTTFSNPATPRTKNRSAMNPSLMTSNAQSSINRQKLKLKI